MSKIIVVFPKKDTATNIRNILVRNGLAVTGIGTTGAQAIQSAETLDEGIVICGYKMLDMMYTELREYLPDTFEMLVIASPDKWGDGIVNGVVGLTMPLKVQDLLSTLNMMLQAIERRRKKRNAKPKARSEKEQALLREAKVLLMNRNNMTEDEAHHYLQKCSVDSGTNMVETAQMVLSVMSG